MLTTSAQCYYGYMRNNVWSDSVWYTCACVVHMHKKTHPKKIYVSHVMCADTCARICICTADWPQAVTQEDISLRVASRPECIRSLMASIDGQRVKPSLTLWSFNWRQRKTINRETCMAEQPNVDH